MLSLVYFFLALFFLIGTFFLVAISSSFRRLHKKESKKQIEALDGQFFYIYLHTSFFPKQQFEGIFFATMCAQNIARFGYTLFVFLFLNEKGFFSLEKIIPTLLSLLLAFFLLFLIGEFLPRLVGTRYPERSLRFSALVASINLSIAFPLTFIFLTFTRTLSQTVYFDYFHEGEAKQEIIEMIHEADLGQQLEEKDRELFESVVSFHNRVVREIMIPRVDVFALPDDIPIYEAAKKLEAEGYSRIPVYKETIDEIVGILMYKDILHIYMESEKEGKNSQQLLAPISTILKSVLFTPESKRITDLLQDFKQKQVHIAVVVDEYGGTEGIITIEDVLEEIVGEIADEYDTTEKLFFLQPDGSWIVDASMSILDLEDYLEITIPQEGDYDSLGGFIYDRAGMIPKEGFTLYHEDYAITVLKSTDRTIETVQIKKI